MKGFFTPIALALFDSYRLCRTVVFHPIKMQMEAGDFLEAFGSFNELSVSQKLDMASDLRRKTINTRPNQNFSTYLKVILFLTDECVVSIREIETFIGIYAVVRN